MRPVFLGQAPVAGRVLAAAYLDSSTVRAPWLSLPEPLAMRHPQFLRDVEAFAADLRLTGQIGAERADTIARVAVREAYHRRIPPALVLGVMLTENDRFARNARSKVGAMGLMQIMPRMWTPNLGPILGRNLKDDETNLRYGVYILKHFAKRTADTLDARDVIRSALLSYNGCVSGRNTPDCKAYPRKVQQRVDESARTICSGRDFHECVALPLWAALRDTAPPPMPPAMANVLTERATDRSHAAPSTSVHSVALSAWLGGVMSARRE
ncbi:MAG: lytic transglycosylase domain-containing protein [bacterium]